MNGQRQSKQPTKKELAKMRIFEAKKMLETIRENVLEATDEYVDAYVPLNLLKISIDYARLDKDADLPIEWITNWNTMLDTFYLSCEKYCFTNRDNEGKPINLPMEAFDLFIDTLKDNIK